MKQCTRCRDMKPRSEFHKCATKRDGLQSHCRGCKSLYRKEARERDPLYSFNMHLKHTHRIDKEIYMSILEAQGGVCALCGTPQGDEKHRLHVDHDHSCCPGNRTCGKCIRGLLCGGCNMGLGGFRDNPDAMRKAIEYVSGDPLLIDQRAFGV